MFTKTNSNKAGKFLQRITMVLLVLAFLFGSLPAGEAYAWVSTPSGRPGRISVPPILVRDSPTCAYFPTYTICPGNMQLAVNLYPLAHRSPASSGSQHVFAYYSVQRWNDSTWTTIESQGPFYGIISPTQTSITFPTTTFSPNESRGYYRFVAQFYWFDHANNFLGSAIITPDRTEDFQCATINRLCQSFPGYFRTGGYQTGTW